MYEFCCRCFGLEVGSLFLNARFVPGVLGAMWRRSAKMYDLLRCLGLEVGSLCEDVRFLLPVFGLEKGSQCLDGRFVARVLSSKWSDVAGALGSKLGRCS